MTASITIPVRQDESAEIEAKRLAARDWMEQRNVKPLDQRDGLSDVVRHEERSRGA